jgi:hypothetical protein
LQRKARSAGERPKPIEIVKNHMDRKNHYFRPINDLKTGENRLN